MSIDRDSVVAELRTFFVHSSGPMCENLYIDGNPDTIALFLSFICNGNGATSHWANKWKLIDITCGNFMTFLSLRFSMKSILRDCRGAKSGIKHI